MPKEKSITKNEGQGSHVAVLIIVDAETLLSRASSVSLSADAPTLVDSEHLYVMSARNDGPLGRNDGHLDLTTSPGNQINMRGAALALRGEHIVFFHTLAHENADVLSPFELVLRGNLPVPTPTFDNLLQLSSQKCDDHYWQSQVLVPGVAACKLDFMVLDKACAILGYFRSHLQIAIRT